MGFGIMFIIVLINVVRVQIEFSFFEAVPAFVAEEDHEHEPDEFLEGWKDLGLEKEEKPPLSGFDFLGGSPSMRDITTNPKNPPIVFWSRSNSQDLGLHPSEAGKPKVHVSAKPMKLAKSVSLPLPYREAAGQTPEKKVKKSVTNDDIVRFFMDRIKEIRRSSGHYSSVSLSEVDKDRLRDKGLDCVQKIVTEYKEKLRKTLTISARILNVELSEIGLEDELSPRNSENEFAHFESLLSPRSKKGTLMSIHEVGDTGENYKAGAISLAIMNPMTTDITDL